MPLRGTFVKEKGTVGSWTRGSLRWSYEDCEADLIDPDTAWVRFTYTVNGTPMHYYVRLVTTQPTYGGLPWWFLRPLGRNDGGPPRRKAKLYLPPGKKYFASRQALVRLSLCALHFLISRCSRREDCDFRGLRPTDFSLNSWGIGARPSCLTPINASLLEMRGVVLNVL